MRAVVVLTITWLTIGGVIVARLAPTRWWWLPGAVALLLALLFAGTYAMTSDHFELSVAGATTAIFTALSDAIALLGAIVFAIVGVALLPIGYVLRRRHLRRIAGS